MMKLLLHILLSYTLFTVFQLAKGDTLNLNKSSNSTAKSYPYSKSYQIKYYNQTLDHFANDSISQKWSHRFLVDDTFWLGAEKLGPILVLTGCETDIKNQYAGNGFYNLKVIPQVGAYAIFAEHRYFGESLPFGNDSFKVENLPYLTTEQALADYAELIEYYKNEVLNCPKCPVITYGGSYCGALAAWMRMRYPDLVDAAMSSAAPMRYYDGVVDPEEYFARSTKVFERTSTPGCADLIKEGFRRLTNQEPEYQEMNEYMYFCKPLTSSWDLSALSFWFHKAYVMGSLLNVVTYSGPYAGIRKAEVACSFLANLTINSSDKELFPRLKDAAMHSFEEDLTTCLNLPGTGGASAPPASLNIITGYAALDILVCGDIPFSVGPDGVHDMFPFAPWNSDQKTNYCLSKYGLKPKFDWPLKTFGGWNISDYAMYNNIFFSTGEYDPWIAGGVTQNVSESVVAYIVEGGCHGEELLWPIHYDSDSVKFVRGKAMEYIKKWIKQKQNHIEKVEN